MSLVKIAFWPLLVGLTVVDPYRHPEMPFLFGILVHNLGLGLGFFTLSGARAASVVVTAMLFLPLRAPCIALIVLHVLSVRTTRIETDVRPSSAPRGSCSADMWVRSWRRFSGARYKSLHSREAGRRRSRTAAWSSVSGIFVLVRDIAAQVVSTRREEEEEDRAI